MPPFVFGNYSENKEQSGELIEKDLYDKIPFCLEILYTKIR